MRLNSLALVFDVLRADLNVHKDRRTASATAIAAAAKVMAKKSAS
jgi:hypothetical protein